MQIQQHVSNQIPSDECHVTWNSHKRTCNIYVHRLSCLVECRWRPQHTNVWYWHFRIHSERKQKNKTNTVHCSVHIGCTNLPAFTSVHINSLTHIFHCISLNFSKLFLMWFFFIYSYSFTDWQYGSTAAVLFEMEQLFVQFGDDIF